jgi:lipoprotein-releasing system permease protein
MSVIEKSKEIAILKAMGCTDKLIQRIFISEGLCLGILGGTLGLASGRVFCALLGRFGLPLGGNLQSFEKLPVAVDPLEVFLVGMSALFIVWLSSIYPARIASRVRPVDAFRQAER